MKNFIVISLIVIAAALGAWYFYLRPRQTSARAAQRSGLNTATGTRGGYNRDSSGTDHITIGRAGT